MQHNSLELLAKAFKNKEITYTDLTTASGHNNQHFSN
jgi:hypothetical protein